MAPSYTTNSGIEKPLDGEQTGSWGDTVNLNMDIIDRSLTGVGSITLSGTTHTLTTTDGTLTDGQYRVLVLGGTPSGTNTITVSPNDQTKLYFVVNNSGQDAVFTQGSGGNVTVANNTNKMIYADGAGAGAAVVDFTDRFAASNIDINGGTIDGTVIGGSSAAAATVTTLTAGATTLNDASTFKSSGGSVTRFAYDASGNLTLNNISNIYKDGAAASFLQIAGGSTAGAGGAAIFYGETHPTDAGQIVLKSAGATALTIDSSQNATFAGDVGIGTIPAEPLHVEGDTNGATIRFDRASNNQAYLGIDSGEALYLSIANKTYQQYAIEWNGGNDYHTWSRRCITNRTYAYHHQR